MSDEPPTREETEEMPDKVATGYDEIGPRECKGHGERVSALYELVVSMWVEKSLRKP